MLFRSKYAYRGGNALLQMTSLLQYSIFTFVKVPSNILIQVALRTNPLGATLNSIWHTYNYYGNLDKFYKKYKIGKYGQTASETTSPNALNQIAPEQRIETTGQRKALPFTSTQALVTTTNQIDVFDSDEVDSPNTKDAIRKIGRAHV